jgi:hypothetical protein
MQPLLVSRCTRTCCGTPAASNSPTMGRTRARCNTTSVTATFSTRSATPISRPIASRASGRTEPGRRASPGRARRAQGAERLSAGPQAIGGAGGRWTRSARGRDRHPTDGPTRRHRQRDGGADCGRDARCDPASEWLRVHERACFPRGISAGWAPFSFVASGHRRQGGGAERHRLDRSLAFAALHNRRDPRLSLPISQGFSAYFVRISNAAQKGAIAGVTYWNIGARVDFPPIQPSNRGSCFAPNKLTP